MSDVVELDVEEVTAETDLAICCLIDGSEQWVPKSQISDDSDVCEEGDSGTLIVARWLAEKNGLV